MMLLMFLMGIAAVFLLEKFVVTTDRVSGFSMQPTLQNGELLLVDRIVYRFEKPHYGDIVAIKWGANGLVKRVIGLPGDVIQIHGGWVYRNGKKLHEPYTATATAGTYGPVTVPANCIFVLGDNRNESRDSRSIGFIPLADVMGRADVILLPFHNFHVQPFGSSRPD